MPENEKPDTALCCAYRRIQKLEDALRRIAACHRNPDPYGYLAAIAKEALSDSPACKCTDFGGERVIHPQCPVHNYVRPFFD